MNELPPSTPLLAVNVELAAVVVLAALAVVGGAIWEVRERRRLRASLPDRWPPTPQEAAAAEAAARRAAHERMRERLAQEKDHDEPRIGS